MTTETQLDAFPEAKMDSPKLSWLKRHDLVTRRLENGRWRCRARANKLFEGVGKTEDEACVSYCLKTGVRHWNLETP